MRRIKPIGAALLLLLLLPGLLLLAAFALPAQYSRTYLAALNDKAAALKQAKSPKIVLIGGSGTAFDVDCPALESQFPGFSAVNFGLYAGLGVPVMLELALPDLQPGDIVVFSPELSEQTLSDWFSPEAMWQASEEEPGLAARLHVSRWEGMLGAFPRYAAKKARLFMENAAPEGSGVYARGAFTEKGDIRPELRPANVMPGGWDENMPLRFDEALPTAEWLDRLDRFCAACGGRGVSVYFRFCPMNAAALQPEEAKNMAAFEARFRALLPCGTLGSAERALLDPAWFFDTNFHLNGAGALMNTVLLAEELKAALGDETPVTLALPQAPEAPAPDIQAGDNRDEACFLYAAAEGGTQIVGLTAEGKARDRLTLPVSHDGLPVLSFTRDTFEGNGAIRELTVQGSIRFLPDGGFAGCGSLDRIILLQTDPAKCSVGPGLLEGTDALVTVPGESFANYCTNYFWAVHASRLVPLEDGPASAPSPAPTASPAPRGAAEIRYDGNGGALRAGEGGSMAQRPSLAHLRVNTLPGTVWFYREGYVLAAWNTRPDGSGDSLGLGSRMDPLLTDTLYAQWLPCSPDSDFDFEAEGSRAAVTGYHGSGGQCVLPESWQGLPVRVIRAGAFQGTNFNLLVLSPALRTVEEGAFQGCEIEEMLLFDSLETISDGCFADCPAPRTLRVNAATSPKFSGSYFDTFPDKYDRMLALQGQRKLVLSSGSSGRYGYDCEMLKKAFPDLEPVNMGVYAYTNALPQLKLLLPLMEAGDILLCAPEFDAAREQFCVSDALDQGFWAMMEGNYDAAAALDMRAFTQVFDSLGAYLAARARMPGKSYDVSPANYDDDGNYYPFSTYNAYGDFILPRPNGDTDGRLRHNIADYTVKSFPLSTLQSLNRALLPFQEKQIRVFLSYTPRNENSLTEESTPEERTCLHQWLREKIAVPVISRMEDYLLPGRYFWLIDSHTSTEGAEIRTRQIIDDLKTALEEGE